MGFKNFSFMNSAFLAKQAWRVFQNPNALWVRVLKSLYFPEGEFSRAKRKRNKSWAWASLIHGKEVVLESARWMVSMGDSIEIRNDRCLASGELPVINDGSELAWVREIIDPMTKSWDVPNIQRNFPASTTLQILQIAISWNCGRDVLWWPGAKPGEFSIKSGYFQIKKREQSSIRALLRPMV